MKIDFFTNSVFSSRTYILSEEPHGDVWLVDCGDIEKILAVTGGRNIVGVLLTYAHFDHMYGLPPVLERFPDAAVCTNAWGRLALADDGLNMSRYHRFPIRVDSPNVCVLKEGDKIFGFDVYETPGHNPSCLCYANDEVIFTGDAYIPGCKVVTNLPHCDKTLTQSSVERILRLAEGKVVVPGHEG